ncbi:SCO2521 family protein [Streptomyces marokkonensis]|uniref:SCO2521 family protein n=1 Tax=Streptomyces marokkonensis TaxID=324855 RepID=UPI0011F1B0CA|nr:SCO2521 family protein [Streptomyces marokkonensis]
MSRTGRDPHPVIACGEVRTCLLPTRDALDERAAVKLLRLRPDERVRVSRHPNRYVVSPEVLTGVDCPLPTDTGARVRAVGTVGSHASLVEGRVIQATASFSLPAVGTDRRQAWSYYLVRPGSLVPVGQLPQRALVRGFLLGHRPGRLDVGSIAESVLARISRQDRILDHDPPLTAADTRLRWTAVRTAAGEEPSSLFTKGEDGLRTLELSLPSGLPPTAAVGLCEELALHDWLLTTVADKLDGLPTGAADDRAVLRVLRPLVDHLLHLWMPRARVDRVLQTVWNQLEETPGYSRQWTAHAQRIRDQLALRAIHLRDEVPGRR